MLHLYLKARETAARQQPVEVRILKHLLTIDDPLELSKSIDDAFTPGEASSPELDFLSTTPARLLKTLDAVLTAYDTQKGRHTLLGETSSLMRIDVIEKLRALEATIRRDYG